MLMSDEIKKLEYELVEVEKLIPYARNSKQHDEKQIDQIAASIREFGFLSPVVIAQDNTILAGHGRILAAKKLNLKKVPCVREDHLSEAQRRAFVIADNKIGENATWDQEMLAVEIADLKEQAFDLSLLGFDDKELSSIFDTGNDGEEDTFDVDGELDNPVFSKTGDVWTLGKHRLVCGDSTKEETYKVLMGEKLANVVITDPPYNVNVEKTAGKIKNDNMKNDEFYTFLLSAFTNMYKSMVDGAAIYIFHSDSEKVNFYNACVNAGFHYSSTCIWVKDSLVIGRADYQQKHEPVLYAFKDTKPHVFYGDRKQTTTWSFPRPKKSDLHPTMKPIPLLCYPMKNSSMANCIVLDPFLGSGSTLIAAEQMDRICYGIELDEKFCDVIVKRYIEQVGTDENVSVERDGKIYKFSEICSS